MRGVCQFAGKGGATKGRNWQEREGGGGLRSQRGERGAQRKRRWSNWLEDGALRVVWGGDAGFVAIRAGFAIGGGAGDGGCDFAGCVFAGASVLRVGDGGGVLDSGAFHGAVVAEEGEEAELGVRDERVDERDFCGGGGVCDFPGDGEARVDGKRKNGDGTSPASTGTGGLTAALVFSSPSMSASLPSSHGEE